MQIELSKSSDLSIINDLLTYIRAWKKKRDLILITDSENGEKYLTTRQYTSNKEAASYILDHKEKGAIYLNDDGTVSSFRRKDVVVPNCTWKLVAKPVLIKLVD